MNNVTGVLNCYYICLRSQNLILKYIYGIGSTAIFCCIADSANFL